VYASQKLYDASTTLVILMNENGDVPEIMKFPLIDYILWGFSG